MSDRMEARKDRREFNFLADVLAESNPMKISKIVLAFAVVLIGICGCKSTNGYQTEHFESVVIQGTRKFDNAVENALALLKSKSPSGYATVTNYIGRIQEHDHSGMKVGRRPPVFQLNTNSAFVSTSWCAGVIAHDSCHSKLYSDYRQQHWLALWVPPRVYSGEQAEKACLEHQLSVLKQVGAPTSEISWCRQCQTNNYWEVRYKDRNW